MRNCLWGGPDQTKVKQWGNVNHPTCVDTGVNYFWGEVTAKHMMMLEQSKKEHGGLSSHPE
jgi:hypothetical protein